jgi:hypothetical protein
MTPGSTVVHLADSFQGLQDAHASNREILFYKDKKIDLYPRPPLME